MDPNIELLDRPSEEFDKLPPVGVISEDRLTLIAARMGLGSGLLILNKLPAVDVRSGVAMASAPYQR
jgi:hypothetical protein